MTIVGSGIAVPSSDGRIYRQLPTGVQPFFARNTVTGNSSGGRAGIRFDFNIDQDNTFAPYVSLTHASFETSTAALTGNMGVELAGGDWERSAGGLGEYLLYVVPAYQTLDSLIFAGAINTSVHAGRGRASTSASIRMQFDNVNNCVYIGHIAGFISDFPYLPGDNIRA